MAPKKEKKGGGKKKKADGVEIPNGVDLSAADEAGHLAPFHEIGYGMKYDALYRRFVLDVDEIQKPVVFVDELASDEDFGWFLFEDVPKPEDEDGLQPPTQQWEMRATVRHGPVAEDVPSPPEPRYEWFVSNVDARMKKLEELATQQMQRRKVEFWEAQFANQVWKIPLDRSLMPWLEQPLVGDSAPALVQTFEKLRERKKTALLLDPVGVVDALLHDAVVIDCGAMLDMVARDLPLDDFYESTRSLLVLALKHGATVLVRMGHLAPDLRHRYCVDHSFPVELFDAEFMCETLDRGLDLTHAMPGHPLLKILRDEELSGPSLVPDPNFQVVLSSKFNDQDYEGYLSHSLPLDLLQPVMISEIRIPKTKTHDVHHWHPSSEWEKHTKADNKSTWEALMF